MSRKILIIRCNKWNALNIIAYRRLACPFSVSVGVGKTKTFIIKKNDFQFPEESLHFSLKSEKRGVFFCQIL